MRKKIKALLMLPFAICFLAHAEEPANLPAPEELAPEAAAPPESYSAVEAIILERNDFNDFHQRDRKMRPILPRTAAKPKPQKTAPKTAPEKSAPAKPATPAQ